MIKIKTLKDRIINCLACPAKFLRENQFFVIAIAVYVILFTLQINLSPFERYPGWDHYWVDARTAGKIFSLGNALGSFELPYLDLNTGFGWNLGGDHHSFWNPLNFLAVVFSPIRIIFLSQMFFLFLGGIGAYLFLNLLNGKNKILSLFGGLSYISVPFVIGLFYYEISSYGFYLIPLLLFLIHKILEKKTVKRFLLFALFSMFIIASADLYFLVVFFATVVLYSFFVSHLYYKSGFFNSFKTTIFLLSLSFLSSLFYVLPLYGNNQEIASALTPLKEMGIYIGGPVIADFLTFFKQNGIESLSMPLEGSALLLYIPIYYYIAIAVVLIAVLANRFIIRKDLFAQDAPKQGMVVVILVVLGIVMFLGSLVFYHPLFLKNFPKVIDNARGVFRYHINLIPFINTLAAFVCFGIIARMKGLKSKIALGLVIAAISLVADLLLFNKQHSVAHLMSSSNLMQLPLKDALRFLPWVNLISIIFIIFYWIIQNRAGRKRILGAICILLAIIIPLLNITVYNEFFSQAGTRVLSRNSYRLETYSDRRDCIDGLVDRYDINYRTLYVGKGVISPSSGRNWKLIVETEIHTEKKEKVLFSYREFEDPYTGLMRGTFTKEGGFNRSNIFPPLASEVVDNLDTVKLMGVKYVISADEKIEHEKLKYIGECFSEEGLLNGFGLGKEGGYMYIYELTNSFGIAFSVDNYEKHSWQESLRSIYDNKNHPWNNSIVYLEGYPNAKKNSEAKKEAEQKNNIKIIKQTSDSLEIKTESSKERYLVLSYNYKPNWKAFIDSKETKIYRAYGGFMSVKIPAGDHVIEFKYTPYDGYLGIIFSASVFFLIYGSRKYYK